MLRYESYGFYSASKFKRFRSLSREAYRSDWDRERIEEFQIASAVRMQFSWTENHPDFNCPAFREIECN